VLLGVYQLNLGSGALYAVIGPDSGWTDPSDLEIQAGTLAGGGTATWNGNTVAPTVDGAFDWPAIASGLSGGPFRVAFVWWDGATFSNVAVSAPWALSSGVSLVVADAAHAHTVDNIVLGTTSAASLLVADAAHGHTVDGVTLNTAAVLALQDALHAHAADALALSTASALAVADATHAHTADNVTLTTGGASLLLADSLHAHAADGLALTVSAYLVVASALHDHTSDLIVLTGTGFGSTWVPGPGAKRIRIGMARDSRIYTLSLDAEGLPVYARLHSGGPLLKLYAVPGNNPGQMMTETGIVLVIL
jgi:hypothetical protein